MDNRKIFEKDLMLDLLEFDLNVPVNFGSDVCPVYYTKLVDEISDRSRWSIVYKLIFSIDDGDAITYWQTSYRNGATESQEEYAWEYDTAVEAIQVEPIEKIITDYIRVKI